MDNATLLKHRIIFLSKKIDSPSANRIIGELLLLDADNHKEKIDLYINSPGGSVSDGLAILDTIQCIEAPVSTICIGIAASMAAWILAAGEKKQRYISPNAEIMIHQMSSIIAGDTGDIQVYAERMINHQDLLVNMLAQFTGQNSQKIHKDLERDFFMSAKQSKRYGVVDRVLKPFSKETFNISFKDNYLILEQDKKKYEWKKIR